MKEFLSETQKRQLMILGIDWLLKRNVEPEPVVKKRKIRKTKKRHKLSLAQRKEISRRMKKMWAAKRNG